jgi:hypothetical protein
MLPPALPRQEAHVFKGDPLARTDQGQSDHQQGNKIIVVISKTNGVSSIIAVYATGTSQLGIWSAKRLPGSQKMAAKAPPSSSTAKTKKTNRPSGIVAVSMLQNYIGLPSRVPPKARIQHQEASFFSKSPFTHQIGRIPCFGIGFHPRGSIFNRQKKSVSS